MDVVEVHSSHQPRCRARLDKVFDGYISLQYIASGSVTVRRDGSASELHAGWFWYCHPGPRFAFGSTDPGATWDHRHLAFTGRTAFEWLARGLIAEQPFAAPPGIDWPARMDEARRLAEVGGRLGQERYANRIEAIVLDLAAAGSAIPGPEPWLVTVLAELSSESGSSELSDHLDYTALARSVGMGASTLRRRFVAATGTTLHAYRLQVRLAAARRLLSETDLTLAAVARRCGYSDQFALSHAFRTETGMTPSAYRRSYGQFSSGHPDTDSGRLSRP